MFSGVLLQDAESLLKITHKQGDNSGKWPISSEFVRGKIPQSTYHIRQVLKI